MTHPRPTEDKATARAMAVEAEVPVVPGTGLVDSVEEAALAAERGVRLESVPAETLAELTGGAVHNGFAAELTVAQAAALAQASASAQAEAAASARRKFRERDRRAQVSSLSPSAIHPVPCRSLRLRDSGIRAHKGSRPAHDCGARHAC